MRSPASLECAAGIREVSIVKHAPTGIAWPKFKRKHDTNTEMPIKLDQFDFKVVFWDINVVAYVERLAFVVRVQGQGVAFFGQRRPFGSIADPLGFNVM
jgi:hypothetical protein